MVIGFFFYRLLIMILNLIDYLFIDLNYILFCEENFIYILVLEFE